MKSKILPSERKGQRQVGSTVECDSCGATTDEGLAEDWYLRDDGAWFCSFCDPGESGDDS